MVTQTVVVNVGAQVQSAADGAGVGSRVGDLDGVGVGRIDGSGVGRDVGELDGIGVGRAEIEGKGVGTDVGAEDGAGVG